MSDAHLLSKHSNLLPLSTEMKPDAPCPRLSINGHAKEAAACGFNCAECVTLDIEESLNNSPTARSQPLSP